MRIAAVQFHIDHEDKQSNFDRVEEFMAEAAKKQVDLIVFPEFFHGGPGRKSIAPNGRERFQEFARRYNIDVVTGSLVERRQDGKVYNVIYYIENTGNILLEYCKVHLWLPERRYLTAGPPEFKTARNRFNIVVGVCACWDVMFNEVFRSMAMDQGAQLILAPAYWVIGDFEDDNGVIHKYDPVFETRLLNALCTARAHENECCVILCNIAYQSNKNRPQPFGVSAGCTQITVPFLGPVAECQHNREEMIIADLDIHTLIADIEKAYQIRKDWSQGKIYNSSLKPAKL
ncbi:carbon-nitrogen hydrolase [Dichotomocladium elegans]|nr:carbon-nitrogen hydrolase [Dichotomocladium elegans]